MKWKTLKELDFTEGSVQLVDDHDGRVFKHSGDGDIVLVPQPSSNPNDPLNWGSWKKQVVFLSVSTFGFMTNMAVGGLGPGFLLFSKHYNIGPREMSTVLTYPVLVLGLANFFWVPAAVYFGKRPVFVLSSLMLFVCQLWGAYAKSFQSLRASVIVGGFAGGSTEALGAAIINDLFFLHERAAKLSIYIVFLSFGSSLGPMCAGFMFGSKPLNFFKQIMSIFTGVNFLAILLFAPETRFTRDPADCVVTAPVNFQEALCQTAGSSERAGKEKAQTPETPIPEGGQIEKKTFLQALSLYPGIEPGVSFFNLLIRPFPLVLFPANTYAILIYSLALSWIVVVASTYAYIIQSSPYNFSPGVSGLINVAILIGNAIGAFLSGAITDWWVTRSARKNHGVFQPESRLIWLIVPALAIPAGCLLYGFGASHRLHWSIIFTGAGLIGVGLTSVADIAMAFAMDSYSPISAESLLLINGMKNVVAFGVSFAASPWVENMGYDGALGMMAGVSFVVLLGAVPMWWFGKSLRHVASTKLRIICW